MLDSAWLAIKIPAETSENDTLTESQSVEPLQRDVDTLLFTIGFALDEETIQQICSNPDPETAFNVMVRRRRAEVEVSTLAAEQKREIAKRRQGTQHVCQIFCGRGGITSKDITVCVDENALGCDVQRWWFFESTIGCAKFYRPKTRQDSNVFSNRIPSISSDFSDTCRITWFPNSQRRREMRISPGRTGRATCGRWWRWLQNWVNTASFRITQSYNKHTGTWGGFEISFTEYVKKNSYHRFAITSTPRQEIQNHTTWAFSTSSLEWSVALVGYAPLSLLMGQTHLKPQWARFMKWTNWLGKRLRGHGHHSKSMLIILLLWLRTQMLDGPLAQMAPRKVDSWPSVQTPNCCNAESQTCLWYPGIRVDWDEWQDLHQQRLEQRQTAMTKPSSYVCAWRKFCSDSWICETGNLLLRLLKIFHKPWSGYWCC